MSKSGGFLKPRVVAVLLSVIFTSLWFSGVQAAANKVTTYKDSNGWKLQVDGEDFFVKGVVWGYTPRGENYSYNLWGHSEEQIKAVLDHDFGLMSKAGVNAVRSFGFIPPKWVTYVYREYGIMSMINPLMGRYGASIGGIWRPLTNYADPLTRETLKNQVVEVVKLYKDVEGVLMFGLGNESNYGLSWSSFEIENLPVGEQNREKAKYLYSLYNEVIVAGKEHTSNHPFTIINGDLQYIDLVKEYVTELDIFGSNMYRGISFTSAWKDAEAKLGLPVVLGEFGSDGYNAKNGAEDQVSQAILLKGQWQEMYNESYGNGGVGNSLGGFLFEWRDEWWKFKQTENLDIQDTNASWSNGGYEFDHVEGRNNMNEEWFGIVRLGKRNGDGVFVAEPRMAYHVLADIWSLDPYQLTRAEINQSIDSIDMSFHELQGDVLALKSYRAEQDSIRLVGGAFSGEIVLGASEKIQGDEYFEEFEFSNGERLDLDFEFEATKDLYGDFTLNILGNVAERDIMLATYGNRGKPIVVQTIQTNNGIEFETDQELNGAERLEIYDYQITYEQENYDLTSFYHVSRFHWGDEGDYFGLLREATDLEGMDIWNAKAPFGVEYTGKKEMSGLKILVGPEVYWGANPKAMAKYSFKRGLVDYSAIHARDLGTNDGSTTATEATSRKASQTALYAKTNLNGDTVLELGGIISNTERMDDDYEYRDGDSTIQDTIKLEDTVGIKARVTMDFLDNYKAYVAINYAGLVADGGDEWRQNGTLLPYSNLGNKQELEAGVLMAYGHYTFYPRVMIRDNLVDANPGIDAVTTGSNLSPGVSPRNTDDDPFAVLDNRETRAAELIFTYDPTPATYFYQWDNEVKEDAKMAFNIVLSYADYDTATDANLFYFQDGAGGFNQSFGEGLESEDVFTIASRMVLNVNSKLKIISNIETGRLQSTGLPGDSTDFVSIDTKLVMDNKYILSAYLKQDAFGPYDFHRQFNITYPAQLGIDYSAIIDGRYGDSNSSKLGINFLYRTLDEGSPGEFEGGDNSYMSELVTYYRVNF
ncbi:MAG: beta-galactosidase [Gammaproteobacteria bacterium]|jgi:beta-galactosidase